jgi:hypothetical protein
MNGKWALVTRTRAEDFGKKKYKSGIAKVTTDGKGKTPQEQYASATKAYIRVGVVRNV